MLPVASTTAMITLLFNAFWTVLAGPGIVLMGSLIGVAIIFWGYNALRGHFKGGRK
jgi:hypothetical protein